MKSGSDRRTIDAALKEAAKTAISGSREERSGHFLGELQRQGKNAPSSVLSQNRTDAARR